MSGLLPIGGESPGDLFTLHGRVGLTLERFFGKEGHDVFLRDPASGEVLM